MTPDAAPPAITVAEIYAYWIKSCGGTRLTEAEVTPRGIRYDRRWMVVDADGLFVTQREIPKMALIRPELDGEWLRLRGRGVNDEVVLPVAQEDGPRRMVRVWDDTCPAVSDGAEADAWLSDFLEAEAHLVHIPDDYVRPDGRQMGQVGFADAYPFLVTCTASLDDLNRRLAEVGEPALPINRFRPNLVMTGCEAYAEDTWARLEIAGVPYAVVKPCVRCVTTTTDQVTAARYREPLRTLATYRKSAKGAIFAQNVVNLGTGTVREGDAVTVVSYQPAPVMAV